MILWFLQSLIKRSEQFPTLLASPPEQTSAWQGRLKPSQEPCQQQHRPSVFLRWLFSGGLCQLAPEPWRSSERTPSLNPLPQPGRDQRLAPSLSTRRSHLSQKALELESVDCTAALVQVLANTRCPAFQKTSVDRVIPTHPILHFSSPASLSTHPRVKIKWVLTDP